MNKARVHHHELEGASLETVGLGDGVQIRVVDSDQEEAVGLGDGVQIRIVDSDQEEAMKEARMVESQVVS